MANRFYRQIKHTNRDEVWIRVMAIENLAKELDCPISVEEWYFNLNTLEWSVVVRVWATEPTPFKALLDKTSKEIYNIIREDNERYLRERGSNSHG
jgi:hypothetical protein